MPPLLIVLIVLAIIFDFLNGVHDSSNIVATMISSRAIPPRAALAMTAIAEFCGPFLFGVAVANTIGHEIVSSDHLNMLVIIAALISAIVWNVLTWLLGIPSSSSHALIGGIIGAVVVGAGWQEIQLAGVLKVVLTLFISPVVGFFAGMIIANIIYAASWKATPRINGVFKKLQVVTSLGLALSHGTNDAQKTMGVITLALIAANPTMPTDEIPLWVKFACAMAIATGTYVGGWRIIRTMGKGLVEVLSPQGMAAESASAAVILTSSQMGFPLSTTHVCTGSIIGSGLGRTGASVRWGVAARMMGAWMITLPSAAVVSAGLWWIGHLIGGTPGDLAIFGAMVAAALFMWWRSRRDPINPDNVNDDWHSDTPTQPEPMREAV